jgi:hypothetical protein
MVLSEFFYGSSPETQRHDEENYPCDLEPQVVKHPPKGAASSGGGLGERPESPAALSLLRSHPRHHP